jgi:ABC-type glycerol-3-phosphate transport system permease component
MKRKISKLVVNVLMYGFLILISLYMILPFFWMLTTSLKPENEIFASPPILVSSNMNLDAYKTIILDGNILRVLLNTFIIASCATIIRLFFCSLGGFGFAKYKFLGKGPLFAILVATLVIPFSITLVPLFVVMVQLKWTNTFLPLIIPGAASAFGIFFMRQYISTIENELLDAARIDGASEFAIFTRIIIPIVAPGMTSLGLIFFMGAWNDFLWPLVILKKPELFTLPIAINQMIQSMIGRPVYSQQMAAAVISIIPLLIIFLVFQRRFVEGITAGAIKG